jgi:rhodanese-related sulfurtransferase
MGGRTIQLISMIAGMAIVMGCAAASKEPLRSPGKGNAYLADVDPQEAYRIVREVKGAVILDVRTQAEYVFNGHPEGAPNIPSELWDENTYEWSVNPLFVEKVEKRFSKDQDIIIMCRSGGRSKRAANQLAGLGFTRVYNMVESFEGKSDTDGLRTVNGWKNRGLPYTYKLDPQLMYWP